MRRIFAIVVLVLLAGAPDVPAQDTLPPSQGGRMRSLGLPVVWKPYVGMGLGIADGQTTHLAAQARAGVYRDIFSPVLELLGWNAEVYVGARDVRLDYGVRASLVNNMLGLGIGADVRPWAGTTDLLLTLASPVRRSGIMRRGSTLQLEWLPTHGGALNAAVTIPLAQPHRGATRPLYDHARIAVDHPAPDAARPADPELAAALAEVRERARWVTRLAVPVLRGPGDGPARSAREGLRPAVDRLGDGHSVDDEIRAYHAAVAHAFSLAIAERAPPGRSGPVGDSLSSAARAILLDRVLLPYDRLLGQRKRLDTTAEFAAHARGAFARWLVTDAVVPTGPAFAAMDVFQHLLTAIEEIRAGERDRWNDARLVWLPLQLALLPEQYDEQEELDTIISHAVGRPLTHGNRIWYVHNDRFQFELIRSIGLAREYHVLWVHDIRGLNSGGTPDRLSILVATQAYLAALRERVAQYDSVGRLPAYMIFLDQHYFEVNRSRALLGMLQDPLGAPLRPSPGADADEQALQDALAQLREAVAASHLLQAERAQYGDAWLRGLVKVHVNITNPADPSFRSRQLLPLIGVPDDLMRDHRKVVVYDVSEEDPYRGMAMYTGMGIGEHYAGRMWEDRALMLQGPAAIGLRDQARILLETHGLQGGLIPHVLRPRQRPPDYNQRVRTEIDSMDATGGVASRAIELHNQTGFAMKEVSVADATLIGLLAPGGVFKIPDSLWMNELLASLLAGSAMRGVRVVMVMPGGATAPSAAWMQMALMHDLASRVVAAGATLAPVLARSGGRLRLGIYDAHVGVDDLGQRIMALRARLGDTPFLRDLFAFEPAVYAMLDSLPLVLDMPLAGAGPAPPGEVAERPKLHMKGFLYMSGEAWARLVSGPPMALGMREYLVQRARQLRSGAAVQEDEMAQALQRIGAMTINPVLDTVPVAERNCRPGQTQCGGGRWAFYLQVGSLNQDYRSMMLDGEAAVLVSGWTSLYAAPDYILLLALAAWPEDQAELDRLLPPPTGMHLGLARWIHMLL